MAASLHQRAPQMPRFWCEKTPYKANRRRDEQQLDPPAGHKFIFADVNTLHCTQLLLGPSVRNPAPAHHHHHYSRHPPSRHTNHHHASDAPRPRHACAASGHTLCLDRCAVHHPRRCRRLGERGSFHVRRVPQRRPHCRRSRRGLMPLWFPFSICHCRRPLCYRSVPAEEKHASRGRCSRVGLVPPFAPR